MKSSSTSISYAHSKGYATFVANEADISAYLALNILIGIHKLAQLAMYWDSDQFIGVEGFKNIIPKQCFTTLGKYCHLADQITRTEQICFTSLPISNSVRREVF